MKVFFRYEKDFANRWTPRIYYDDPPTSSIDGQVREFTPTQKKEVDADFGVGKILMDRLINEFPAPEETGNVAANS